MTAINEAEETPAIKLARKYVEAQAKAAERALLGRECAPIQRKGVGSIRNWSQRHGLPYSSVTRHVRSLQKTGLPTSSFRESGRPRTLTEAEDAAVVAYVVEAEKAGRPVTKDEICEAATLLRSRRRPPDLAPPHEGWYRDWKKKHPELRQTRQQPVEASRLGLEAEVEETERWFERTKEKAREQGVTASAVWNGDEVGCRLGVRDGRLQVVVVAKKKHKKPRTVDPANRESYTLVGGGNAVGDSLPPFVILQQWPLAEYEDIDLPGDTTFVRSPTGFSNAAITLAWIRLFNRVSWPLVAAVQALGSPTLEDWFGYQVDGTTNFPMDSFDQDDTREESLQKAHGSRIWRWLILDGFTGHLSIEIVDYCLRFDIQLITLPAHSSHLMQPMDVGVFSHLKHEHQKVLFERVREGEVRFTRKDFIDSLKVT
ncbi:hypothetical protein RB599_003443 [Gaeumannomyces hyphopodioides]